MVLMDWRYEEMFLGIGHSSTHPPNLPVLPVLLLLLPPPPLGGDDDDSKLPGVGNNNAARGVALFRF
jgi:hypothetical protein